MVAFTSAAPTTVTPQIPIETMRGVAIVLLVSYHVIGADNASGLALAYPDMLRLFADFFIDLRMPFFAFIAGFVYAVRSPSRSDYLRFMRGKITRLFVPFALASVSFAVVASLLGNQFALSPAQIPWVPVTSYAHFWFLQSAMVIFALYGLFDALVQRRFSALVLLLSAWVYVLPLAVDTAVMSVNGALYLFPYFMLGVVMNRYGTHIWSDAERLSLLLLCAVVVCALWNIKILYETGGFSYARRDMQSLGFGLSVCALAFLCAPRLPFLERLSPYGLTIYLYHIFGTVAAREVCDVLQIASVELRFVIGLAGGLALPIVLQDTVRRVPGVSLIVLGRGARAVERRAPVPA